MSQAEDADAISSLRYDGVNCAELVAERDQLAAQYGVAVDYRRGPNDPDLPVALASGFGWIQPDTRDARRREYDRARGMISAMNGSIIRRRC